MKKSPENGLPDLMLGWQFHPEGASWWALPEKFDEIYYAGEEGGYQMLLGRLGRRVFYEFDSW